MSNILSWTIIQHCFSNQLVRWYVKNLYSYHWMVQFLRRIHPLLHLAHNRWGDHRSKIRNDNKQYVIKSTYVILILKKLGWLSVFFSTPPVWDEYSTIYDGANDHWSPFKSSRCLINKASHVKCSSVINLTSYCYCLYSHYVENISRVFLDNSTKMKSVC